MVVVVEPRIGQALGLVALQHAEGDAGFQAQCLHLAHHHFHLVEVAVFGAAPGGTHAEAGSTIGLGLSGGLHHGLHFHQRLLGQPGFETDALWAVGAVFRAGTGLDAEQGGELHRVGPVKLPVQAVRLEQEIVERQGQQGLDLIKSPVRAHGLVAGGCGVGHVSPLCNR